MKPLPRRFYDRDTVQVAEELLGCNLVCRGDGTRIGRIVETEAYCGPEDLACHASKGRTARTEVMFGEPGHAYVFLIYGMHFCFNVVTERRDYPGAVLVRAVEPVQNCLGPTNGPGRTCRALGIDKALNGEDLLGERLFITPRDRPLGAVVRATRVGVEYAGEWAKKPWRFYEAQSPWVSKPREALPAPAKARRVR